MKAKCEISGEEFSVSALEQELRDKFGVGDSLPKMTAAHRFQYMGAFWPQWNLYKRKCDRSGKDIVSVFRPDCEYPVWDREEWIEHSNPPVAEFDPERGFFEQAWELFRQSPIPHIFQSHNQNCEYTDDWYYSKNCYLCHSGQHNEDCRYCYASDTVKNVHYGVFSFNSEVCIDLINSKHCFNGAFLLTCKNVRDSAFLYDCRDCSDCLFCFNLRNKQYCFGNKQLSKEEFEKKKEEWDLGSREVYEKAKGFFAEMMKTIAWHRALQIDICDDSFGSYIRNCKNCENCYILSFHENCVNDALSGPDSRWTLDSVGTVGAELSYMCSLPVFCYDARWCFSVDHCKFIEYSAYLQNCQYCFGCCGLVNKKYCIFNKQYSEEEYKELRAKIVEHMKERGEWGEFFPGHFAPNPYEESFSGFFFPDVSNFEGKFRHAGPVEKREVATAEVSEIPGSLKDLDKEKEAWLLSQVFWDEEYSRPFRIDATDISYARKLGVPIPCRYYIARMQENLRWMPFDGRLREAACARSKKLIKTNWPSEYDGRILCEEEYLKVVK